MDILHWQSIKIDYLPWHNVNMNILHWHNVDMDSLFINKKKIYVSHQKVVTNVDMDLIPWHTIDITSTWTYSLDITSTWSIVILHRQHVDMDSIFINKIKIICFTSTFGKQRRHGPSPLTNHWHKVNMDLLSCHKVNMDNIYLEITSTWTYFLDIMSKWTICPLI